MAQQSIIHQAPSHLQLRRTTGGIVDLMIPMTVVDNPVIDHRCMHRTPEFDRIRHVAELPLSVSPHRTPGLRSRSKRTQNVPA